MPARISVSTEKHLASLHDNGSTINAIHQATGYYKAVSAHWNRDARIKFREVFDGEVKLERKW